uniref:F-box domain-containing protein n=1 Tax=Eptatretus burgeri TaxID=7764 RepID=A0A8C4NG55_EPTBU
MATDQGDSSSFLQLPPELLSRILCELPGPSVAVVACTCRLLRAAASLDSVWRHRCRAEYRVWVAKQSMVDAGVCFRELYTNLLYPYKQILGLWQPLIGPYGGLLNVVVEGYWILGWMYMPPRDPRVSEPMRRKPLFRISLGALGTTQVHCMYGHNGPHMAHIQISTNNEFSTKCVQTDFHRMSGGRQEGASRTFA